MQCPPHSAFENTAVWPSVDGMRYGRRLTVSQEADART